MAVRLQTSVRNKTAAIWNWYRKRTARVKAENLDSSACGIKGMLFHIPSPPPTRSRDSLVIALNETVEYFKQQEGQSRSPAPWELADPSTLHALPLSISRSEEIFSPDFDQYGQSLHRSTQPQSMFDSDADMERESSLARDQPPPPSRHELHFHLSPCLPCEELGVSWQPGQGSRRPAQIDPNRLPLIFHTTGGYRPKSAVQSDRKHLSTAGVRRASKSRKHCKCEHDELHFNADSATILQTLHPGVGGSGLPRHLQSGPSTTGKQVQEATLAGSTARARDYIPNSSSSSNHNNTNTNTNSSNTNNTNNNTNTNNSSNSPYQAYKPGQAGSPEDISTINDRALPLPLKKARHFHNRHLNVSTAEAFEGINRAACPSPDTVSAALMTAHDTRVKSDNLPSHGAPRSSSPSICNGYKTAPQLVPRSQPSLPYLPYTPLILKTATLGGTKEKGKVTVEPMALAAIPDVVGTGEEMFSGLLEEADVCTQFLRGRRAREIPTYALPHVGERQEVVIRSLARPIPLGGSKTRTTMPPQGTKDCGVIKGPSTRTGTTTRGQRRFQWPRWMDGVYEDPASAYSRNYRERRRARGKDQNDEAAKETEEWE